MATRRVTLNLTTQAWERLQALRTARELASDDEVVEQALAEMEEDTHSFASKADLDAWIRDVVIPGEEEDRAHPETDLTMEEFEKQFWQRHAVPRSA